MSPRITISGRLAVHLLQSEHRRQCGGGDLKVRISLLGTWKPLRVTTLGARAGPGRPMPAIPFMHPAPIARLTGRPADRAAPARSDCGGKQPVCALA